MFLRSLTPNLLEQIEDMPVVALLGPRQVGKTTLIRHLENQFAKKTLYLDLESPQDLNRLQDAELYLSERADFLIILDEVQRMPSLFPLLRSLIDRKRAAGRFVLLGSASPKLLEKSAESLAGRISYVELHPLHWGEVSEKIPYTQHWLRGGFPEMLLASSDRTFLRRAYDFINTYIERELPLLGLNTSPQVIRNLFTMLLSTHGNLLNTSELSRALGLSVPTIQRYLDFLESAFLIRRLQPYFLNINKRLVKSPKLYFRDSGILHVLAGLSNQEALMGHLLLGSSWEGYIVQQIIAQLSFDVQPYFYRTADGAELDLLLVRGGVPVLGFEIKYSNAPKLTKGSHIALRDLNNIPLLVVTPSAEDFSPSPTTTVCSLQTLKNHLEKHGVIDSF